MMNQVLLLPVLAGLMFVVVDIYNATSSSNVKKNAWIASAVLSAVFACLSLQGVITDGPFGFWAGHTRNLWGNQIWLDLLLAGGVVWRGTSLLEKPNRWGCVHGRGYWPSLQPGLSGCCLFWREFCVRRVC